MITLKNILWIMLLSLSITGFAHEHLSLQSPAFPSKTMIPTQFTCHGADHSPPLIWQHASAETQSFVLIVEDPDALGGVWDHWVLFNIPPNVTQLTENTSNPSHATSGLNSWGSVGYRGPCPPSGTHRYVFKLYALNASLHLRGTPSKQEVFDAMQGHIIASAEWIGRFQSP